MSEIQNEETTIGIHSSGIELEEGLNVSISRNYCANCKRNIHCFVKVDKDTHEAIIENNCTNDSCRCNCREKYACKQCGNLHPYGKKCDRMDLEPVINSKSEAEIRAINEEWKKFQATKQQNIPQITNHD